MDGQNVEAILAKLDHHTESLLRIERRLDQINGCVRKNELEIAGLKATSLRIDAIKLSAIIGGVAVLVGAVLKVAGLW